jgi:DNA-directed RNA polymerase specialized sigma24 family protein
MTNSSQPFPVRVEGLCLHIRQCAKEADAPADLCAGYLRPLLDWIMSCYPKADPDTCVSAVHTAIMNYLQHPQQYDPCRLDLGAYLRMAARADLKNLLKAQTRKQRGEIAWNSVEEGGDPGNDIGKDDDPARLAERAEDAAVAQQTLDAITAHWDEAERTVLLLMLEGERATADFAALLGIADRPPAEQEREVKRVKDRIKRRLQRWGEAHGR